MDSDKFETAEKGLETGNSLAEVTHLVDNPKSSSFDDAFSGISSIEDLRDAIADDTLSASSFTSPFECPQGAFNPSGKRFLDVPLVYCDQTASNRPLRSIEKYMEEVCLPLYGNTHTNTSVTGSQSTAFVAEARQIIAEETNAKVTGKASLDVVLFAGNGATSAVELLIDCLGLRYASETERPVVFIGPYEHHSNLIPWRESGCEIVMIPESKDFEVDCEALETLLQKKEYNNRMKMGTFSAASNVTGKVSDVDRIADILHRHGALAFFDYATAASYMPINMNPLPSSRYPSVASIAKDAVFISPHKMIGGINTPGVLVVKKSLVSQTNPPKRSGGGTVFYVTSTGHRFLSNRIERFEGGSPNIAGIIRAGLVFLEKRLIDKKFTILSGADKNGIQKLDMDTHAYAVDYLSKNAKNIVLLGKEGSQQRLPIISFLVRFQNRFLHYNFVCAVLNDLFGIQSRGGCQCAGPYSQRLLGLSRAEDDKEIPTIENEEIESILLQYKGKVELWRPGYTRLCLPFKGLRSVEVDYVLKALCWISEHCWALMCQYRFSHKTGEWRHASRQGRPLGSDRRWLSSYSGKRSGNSADENNLFSNRRNSLEGALSNADLVFNTALRDRSSIAQSLKLSESSLSSGEEHERLETLRWFVYPRESALLLEGLSEGKGHEPLAGALDPVNMKRSESINYPSISNLNDTDGIVPANKDSSETFSRLKSSEPEDKKKSLRETINWGIGRIINTKALPDHPGKTYEGSPKVPKKNKFKHVQPPPKLMRLMNQAIVQWNMVEDGDKILLGLSGGKDSLSLLHCLLEFKRKSPLQFSIEVCTIDPMTPSFDPSSLIGYVENLGLKYHYIRDEIIARAQSAGKDGGNVSSLCSFCARMKRGNLYTCARENGCNKLALAQHLDDCAESLMMSIMHNGFLRTMKANYKIDAGDISVIRPLIYCRESVTTNFAKSAHLPIVNENCPACFEEPKERARIKKLLSREESMYPNFYDNIRRSIIPLMHDDISSILRAYTEEVTNRSRKVPRSNGEKKRKHEEIDSSVGKIDPENNSLDPITSSLAQFSDEDLVKELVRRKKLNSAENRQSVQEKNRLCTIGGGCDIFD